MNAHAPHWQAWVDGTAAPNPGRIGIGLLLVSPDGLCQEHSRATGRCGCNNEAEVRAIAAALEAAAIVGARRLTIHSDSRFAIDCLTGLDTTGIPRLAQLLDSARTAIARFEQITLVWLPRHRNTGADALARASLGLAAKSATPKKNRRRN